MTKGAFAQTWFALSLCAPLACGGVEQKPSNGQGGTSGSSASGGSDAGAPSAGRGGAMATGGSSTAGGSLGSGTGGKATGGAAQGGTGGIAPPVDKRPPAPEWEPDIPLAEPGWKDSTTPLCEPYLGALSNFEVWADARGVYSLFATICNPLAPGSCAKEGGGSLQFNDGSGWRQLYQATTLSDVKLTGFPNGPLVLTGEIDGRTGIFFYANDKLTLVHQRETSSPPEVFVADADLAYALIGNSVLEYRGESWKEIANLPTRPLALWASSETLLVASEDRVYRKTAADEALKTVPTTPAGTSLSIWGTSNDEFWIGNSLGQLVHYDGSDWTVVESGASGGSDAAIRTLWGTRDVLYFASYSEVGRVENGQAELIVSGSSKLDPQSMWGRSESEIFFTVKDMSFNEYACGGAFILWYDGSKFHQF